MTGITLIQLGGWIFWALLISELALLCFLMGDEEPSGTAATVSLVATMLVIFLFGDISLSSVVNWPLSRLTTTVLIGIGYIIIGILFSFFWMWPRYGKFRRLCYKEVAVRPWLKSQGIEGDEIPPRLREAWKLVVFGNKEQKLVQDSIVEARRIYFTNVLNRDIENREVILTSNEELDFVNLIVGCDAEMIPGTYLQRYVVRARHDWLKTQKAEITNEIPLNLRDQWRKRVLLPYEYQYGNSEWAKLATEPLFQQHKGRLAAWAVYWPPMLISLCFQNVVVNGWHNFVKLFESLAQRVMRKQYASVRTDFETPEESSA